MNFLNTSKEKRKKLTRIAEQYVLDTIRYEHPDWIDQNGECQKCYAYYESLGDIVTIDGIDP